MSSRRDNLNARELIGLRVEIRTATDPTMNKLKGIVRDETKNTLKVETDGRIRTVPKVGTILDVEFSSGESAILNGRRLAFRPEDRVKRGIHWQ